MRAVVVTASGSGGAALAERTRNPSRGSYPHSAMADSQGWMEAPPAEIKERQLKMLHVGTYPLFGIFLCANCTLRPLNCDVAL